MLKVMSVWFIETDMCKAIGAACMFVFTVLFYTAVHSLMMEQ